jgi:hypothetical protein
LLIEIRGRTRAPIALKNLLVTFNTHCALNVDREQRDTYAVVIQCLATDAGLRNYFLMIANHLANLCILTLTSALSHVVAGGLRRDGLSLNAGELKTAVNLAIFVRWKVPSNIWPVRWRTVVSIASSAV